MSWTDERVEILTRMWGEGQSATQIAKELGGVTRNAVIGKVHRLGLSNRAAAPAAAEQEPAPPEPAVAEAPAAEPLPVLAAADPVEPEPEPVPADEVEAPAAPAAGAGNGPASVLLTVPAVTNRRPVITAGQPLPPQPALNEISPESLANAREVEKRAVRISLMELTERTCKWPVGDPATPDFWFCGLPAQPGKPYCEAHVGVAFQPMSARRDRRR